MTTERCRFAHVTDLHLALGNTDYGPEGDATLWLADGRLHERIVTTPAVLAALFDEIRDVDFVVATGDLTNNGTDEEFAAYVEIVNNAPLPIVSIPGNHDHHSAETSFGNGEPLPYERYLGDRWFSFDRGGVHFAAIDWFTHRLGIDNDEQERWLADDLAAVAAATPIVLLTHDQMPAAFFRRMPRQPVLTLSGHWHTSRVVADGVTLHVNTANATFGGLDYSPPEYRVIDVSSGGGVTMRTVVRGRTPVVGGGVHMTGAEPVGDLIVVARKSEDTAAGELEAIDAVSRERVWTYTTASALKAAPRGAADVVIACTVRGELICLDAATGSPRWITPLHDDPLHLWCYQRPVVHDGLVFAGDVDTFAALDIETGAIRWCAHDLGRRENLTTVTEPVIAGGLVVGAFAGQIPALFGLDPHTGERRWPDGPIRGVYEPGVNLALGLPQVIVGGITADPDGDDVYVVRLGSRVERIDARTGDLVWAAPFHGWFNPAKPAVVGDAVVATASTGEVWCFDRATGDKRWSTVVATDAPIALGPYRANGASMLSGVLAIGDWLLQPAGDERIVVLDLASGGVVDAIEMPVPVVAPLTQVGDAVIAMGIDGSLLDVPLPS